MMVSDLTGTFLYKTNLRRIHSFRPLPKSEVPTDLLCKCFLNPRLALKLGVDIPIKVNGKSEWKVLQNSVSSFAREHRLSSLVSSAYHILSFIKKEVRTFLLVSSAPAPLAPLTG